MFWADEQMTPVLSDAEYQLRVRFVDEYVLDRNGRKACIRMGFHASLADSYWQGFLSEPVVQNLIRKHDETFYDRLTSRDPALMSQIAARLYGEAMTAQNDSTRVNALSKLINMMGMDQTTKPTPPNIYIGIKEDPVEDQDAEIDEDDSSEDGEDAA